MKAEVLNKKNIEDLRAQAKEKIEEKRDEDDQKIKKKHWVK